VATAPRAITHDDRVFKETKWLSAIIVPFLLVAFYILYLRPGDTKDLFAWEIKPRMTAMMLGSAYIGGAYFFTRAFLSPRWHWIALGFLPVTAFASLMGIATILHWDRFTQGHISFYTWVLLYVTTPFLVFVAWLRNRRTDPGTPDPDDLILPRAARYAIGVVGVITLLISILLFVQPNLMISIWPWTLTPLTARVVGGMFALPGVLGVSMAYDPRWSSARIMVESQVVSIAFIVLAAILSWDNFNQSNASTWLFMGGMVLLLIGLPILYFMMESRRRQHVAVRQV
jgi:hypothetical protein